MVIALFKVNSFCFEKLKCRDVFLLVFKGCWLYSLENDENMIENKLKAFPFLKNHKKTFYREYKDKSIRYLWTSKKSTLKDM